VQRRDKIRGVLSPFVALFAEPLWGSFLLQLQLGEVTNRPSTCSSSSRKDTPGFPHGGKEAAFGEGVQMFWAFFFF
jgi:hypothetical protein